MRVVIFAKDVHLQRQGRVAVETLNGGGGAKGCYEVKAVSSWNILLLSLLNDYFIATLSKITISQRAFQEHRNIV